MPPFEGLEKAMAEATFWQAFLGFVSAALSVIGAKRAGRWVRRRGAEQYERDRHPSGADSTAAIWRLEAAMRGVENALRDQTQALLELIRAEGSDTRKAVHDEAKDTREMLGRVERRVIAMNGRGSE